MKVENKVVVVTGGASGIGEALCDAFSRSGARMIVVADLDGEKAAAVAKTVGGVAFQVDVTKEDQVAEMAAQVVETHGAIDLYCSNAGIFHMDSDPLHTTSNELWQLSWEVNVMAHVYASRAVIPGMLKQGSGYFLITASAAGLLNQIGSASYGTTKHAAVGFAETLSIKYADKGIGVSALCPQAVRTPMVERLGGPGVAGLDGTLEPQQLAQAVLEGLEAERFLILPHPDVLTYIQHKAADYDRWLRAMRRLRDQFSTNSQDGI